MSKTTGVIMWERNPEKLRKLSILGEVVIPRVSKFSHFLAQYKNIN